MLGSALVRVLAARPGLHVTATSRRDVRGPGQTDGWYPFDAETDNPTNVVRGQEWVVNAIGLIRHVLDEANPRDRELASRVNARFPHTLSEVAAAAGARVIQIATDCVFDGSKGGYVETDQHTASDLYGTSKSNGEVRVPGFVNLRCSIVGREEVHQRSLLEWLLSHPRGAEVPGYTDHLWNGITTKAFALLVVGIIEHDLDLPMTQHVVPADRVSKYDLLKVAAVELSRRDLRIVPVESGTPVDRTLSTLRPEVNEMLWKNAGWSTPPKIQSLVAALGGAPA